VHGNAIMHDGEVVYMDLEIEGVAVNYQGIDTVSQ